MPDFAYCKLEIFIPESHFVALQQALQAVDAGHIGKYDCCLSYSRVTGCWLEQTRISAGRMKSARSRSLRSK